MPVGFRIFKDIERPAKEIVEGFRGIPSSNIGDSMNRLYCMNDDIKPYNNNPLLGTAFTVKLPAGDNLMLQMAIDYAQPGDILVVDGEGALDHALYGGLLSTRSERAGLAGAVINGSIRDLDTIQELSIPVYAKGVTPSGPYRVGPGEMNVPVVCGGQVVMPGDILVGDADSIVVIRKEDAAEVLENAKRIMANEDAEMRDIASGKATPEEYKAKFEKIFFANGGEVLKDNK